MITAEQALEFNKIKELLAGNAFSQAAKQRLLELKPSMDEAECIRLVQDTTSARDIMEAQGAAPLPFMAGLDDILTLSAAGAMLLPEQLTEVMQFAVSCRRVKRYLATAETTDSRVGPYGRGVEDLDEPAQEIERCIRHNAVDSNASSTLHGLRRQMEGVQAKIKEKLNSLLSTNRKWFSDSYVVQRNGRQVLPVKREYKNSVNGAVVEISSSKSTYFIEPSSVRKLTDQLQQLEIEEDAEVRRILYTLTAMVEEYRDAIGRNMELMEELDFIFAKARLSQQMDGIPAQVGAGRAMNIIRGRHPLLDRNSCVPLDFSMGEGYSGVIITGPNTGGKTVAIKTVGLLCMMAQCGLHIPAEQGSSVCMNAGYHCDIGDSQNIAENLSTFSGHMTNIISILEQAGPESLVLLDELGSGTDPAEGMGIAIAVLDELRRIGCLFLVTTHYPEVKDYASATPGVTSARMAFDRETLSPLYRLELGRAGESCALYIAQRLGLPPHILRHAYDAAYNSKRGGECNTAPPDIAIAEGEAPLREYNGRSIKKQQIACGQDAAIPLYEKGDSVTVLPGGDVGIVYRPADDKGLVCVQIKSEKQMINHKRLKLRLKAKELYPEDYDFSIIFDSVADRKASKKMGKRHRPDLQIEIKD